MMSNALVESVLHIERLIFIMCVVINKYYIEKLGELYNVLPVKLTFLRYRSKSAPLAGRMASHRPGRPPHTAPCMSLSTKGKITIRYERRKQTEEQVETQN